MNIRTSESRLERKERTRQELMQAALALLEDQSFSSVSLREVTREAGVVPTAFYRHFESMEELGLALIDESFRTLREVIREVRAESAKFEHVIRDSVDMLISHVHEHRLQFQFIARERFSGVAVLRHAIRAEIRLFASELATDLVRVPEMSRWSAEDLRVMAGLIVNAMISIIEDILDTPTSSSMGNEEIRRTAQKRMRMIVLAAGQWRSVPSG